MDDERAGGSDDAGRDDADGGRTSHRGDEVDAGDATRGDPVPDDGTRDDGERWDPPAVERRTDEDASAVAVGYPDMDEIIEPGSIDLENALFVALGMLGTVGLLFYVVSIAS